MMSTNFRLLGICVFFLIIGQLHAQSICIATYNIRQDAKVDIEQGNGWPQRRQALVQLIKFHDFDVFGAQEVLSHQLDFMLASLSDYNSVGVGRDDGLRKGEFSPIFYKKDRFEKLENGHFWLSESKDTPSKGWDAAYTRICTWVLLKDLKTKKKFFVFNTHFDHRGEVAKLESVNLILRQIHELGKNKIPVVLTGDFNVDQDSEAYKLLAGAGVLQDAVSLLDDPYLPNGTFNAFKVDVVSVSRIDHIFVSAQFDVLKYGILTDTYHPKEVYDMLEFKIKPPLGEVLLVPSKAKVPSDHYPVKVEVILK